MNSRMLKSFQLPSSPPLRVPNVEAAQPSTSGRASTDRQVPQVVQDDGNQTVFDESNTFKVPTIPPLRKKANGRKSVCNSVINHMDLLDNTAVIRFKEPVKTIRHHLPNKFCLCGKVAIKPCICSAIRYCSDECLGMDYKSPMCPKARNENVLLLPLEDIGL